MSVTISFSPQKFPEILGREAQFQESPQKTKEMRVCQIVQIFCCDPCCCHCQSRWQVIDPSGYICTNPKKEHEKSSLCRYTHPRHACISPKHNRTCNPGYTKRTSSFPEPLVEGIADQRYMQTRLTSLSVHIIKKLFYIERILPPYPTFKRGIRG